MGQTGRALILCTRRNEGVWETWLKYVASTLLTFNLPLCFPLLFFLFFFLDMPCDNGCTDLFLLLASRSSPDPSWASWVPSGWAPRLAIWLVTAPKMPDAIPFAADLKCGVARLAPRLRKGRTNLNALTQHGSETTHVHHRCSYKTVQWPTPSSVHIIIHKSLWIHFALFRWIQMKVFDIVLKCSLQIVFPYVKRTGVFKSVFNSNWISCTHCLLTGM